MPGTAGGKAKGSGGPTPEVLGYSLPPNPDPPAVIPGVWAAVEPSVGASRPDDVPGDPSAAFPYSLWVLRGSFAAVSLKVIEERGVIPRAAQQSPRLALSSFVRGAEWGLLQPKPLLGSHGPQWGHCLSPADLFSLLMVLPSSPICQKNHGQWQVS